MSDAPDLKDALAALARDVAEHAAYLRELGVEGLQGVTLPEELAAPARQAQPAAPRPAVAVKTPAANLPPALARNAAAESKAAPAAGRSALPKLPRATTRAPNVPALPASGRATFSAGTDEPEIDMAKRTSKQKPTPDAPAPQETLFGEVTPMDAASLPKSGETLEDIRADIGECIRCPLSQGRTKVVHSEGNPEARLMFVGEAPGADEDAQGRPFVGRAGQLLNKIIEAIGLRREDVFIGNVNRCRPPGNRTPTIEEAKACKGFLLREVAVVRPEVIVVLGNTAMKNLLDTKEGITKLRGQFQDYHGIKVMPTFHPAYLLRDPSKKRETWEDMKKVREYLAKTRPGS